MRRPLATALAAMLAVLAAPLAVAQAQEGSDGLRIDAVEVDDHPAVRFSVSVPAGEDGLLPADAFRVTEDGQERPATVAFADSSDLQIVMLIDTTGSMGGPPLAGAKDAATSFLSDIPEDTGVAVVGYDTEATVIADFGATREEQIDGIDGLAADGSTALYDAVQMAAELFPDAGEDTRRVIVLLTDGEDNESQSTVEEAITALTDRGISLTSIEYLTAFAEGDAIRSMANATDGEVLQAEDAEALTRVYEELAADLISRYAVTYRSASNGSVDLTVTVDVDDQALTAIRTITLPNAIADPAEEPDPEPPDEATPAPPIIPPEETGNAGIALIVGAVLWFVALALLLAVLLTPRRRPTQLSGASARRGVRRRGLSELATQASMFAERSLERRGYRGRLNDALERAGIELRPGEFLVLVASAAVTALAVGRILNGWLVAVLLVVLTPIVARLVVSFMTERRQKRFSDQLGETLQLLSGSLRAGYSLMQAVDAVAREAPSPAAEEFGRLVVETRLGRDMDDALRAMADRMQSDDFTWVMQAIEIHREVGGDLAEVLDTVAGTIRERNQIRRQVQALSAEGRLSAYILLALPFGVGFIIYLTNRPYLAELTNGGLLGWGLILIGALLMTVGVVWIRKLVKLVF